jgi:RHS repeat-associated protein
MKMLFTFAIALISLVANCAIAQQAQTIQPASKCTNPDGCGGELATITWPTPASIGYGTALSSTQLDATASTGGTFSYSPAAGTVLPIGTNYLTLTFTPADTAVYATTNAMTVLTVTQALPVITWGTPGAITYGTALSATQLDATATVNGSAAAGTLTYSPALGTVPAAGTDTLSVTFTPTNTTDYATVTSSVNLTVNKEAPVVTWATPAEITYGVALSATQLDATASVAGAFTYTPALGTVPAAGTNTLSVSFTPTNTTDYGTATSSVSLTVGPATPAITWVTPTAISYGTAISATQLNATASVAGAFVYSPALGTVPGLGEDTLSVTFTPTNSTDYKSATSSVTLTVNKATPVITWPTPAAISYGTALSATQLNATASVAGTFVYSPAAGTIPTAGTDTLSLTFTPSNNTDYNTATKTVSLSVAPPVSDSGTVTLTVGGVTAATTNYETGANTSTIAEGLAAGVTSGSFVNVTAVNDNLYLVAKQAGAGTNYSYSIQTTSYNSTDFTQPSFVYPPLTGSLEGGANAGTAGQTQPIYSFNGVYDGVGNLTNYTDSVMGNWGFSYDSLNRIRAGNSSSGAYNNQHLCWAYDSFGNRTAESLQTTACPTSETSVTPTAAYNSYNQVTSASGIGAEAGYTFSSTFTYDAAGDVTNDTTNRYLYDAEGRICAVQDVKFGGTISGYIYGADGARVAKGTITSWSCDPSTNGFTPISDYILGSSNEQLTELDMDPNQGVMAWQHTNVWTNDKLLATYDNDGLHFYFNDPLGTRRAQTDYAGVLQQTCQSLPYGNAETCGPTPTEHLFTGKERDAESGNDYFGARYYGSSMGRFMSPDWSATADPVPYARMDNPQSLNLYAYVGNDPLSLVDRDGHCYGQQKSSVWSCIGGFFRSLFGGGGGGNGGSNGGGNGGGGGEGSGNNFVVTSTIFSAGAVGGVGHHYIPQSLSQDFNDSTQQFSNNITSGSLTDRTVNYFDSLHRAYNARVANVISQYLEETGKNVRQLSTSDIKAIVQRMKNAGGAIEDFNTRLETANPGVRSMEEGVDHASQVVGNSDAVQAVEQAVEECEMGAPCVPPM